MGLGAYHLAWWAPPLTQSRIRMLDIFTHQLYGVSLSRLFFIACRLRLFTTLLAIDAECPLAHVQVYMMLYFGGHRTQHPALLFSLRLLLPPRREGVRNSEQDALSAVGPPFQRKKRRIEHNHRTKHESLLPSPAGDSRTSLHLLYDGLIL